MGQHAAFSGLWALVPRGWSQSTFSHLQSWVCFGNVLICSNDESGNRIQSLQFKGPEVSSFSFLVHLLVLSPHSSALWSQEGSIDTKFQNHTHKLNGRKISQ